MFKITICSFFNGPDSIWIARKFGNSHFSDFQSVSKDEKFKNHMSKLDFILKKNAKMPYLRTRKDDLGPRPHAAYT